MTPLLPLEIRLLFDDSGIPPAGLPPLLISRQYRAQARTGFVFEAFFVITEAGVRFRKTFTAEFDVRCSKTFRKAWMRIRMPEI